MRPQTASVSPRSSLTYTVARTYTHTHQNLVLHFIHSPLQTWTRLFHPYNDGVDQRSGIIGYCCVQWKLKWRTKGLVIGYARVGFKYAVKRSPCNYKNTPPIVAIMAFFFRYFFYIKMSMRVRLLNVLLNFKEIFKLQYVYRNVSNDTYLFIACSLVILQLPVTILNYVREYLCRKKCIYLPLTSANRVKIIILFTFHYSVIMRNSCKSFYNYNYVTHTNVIVYLNIL